MRTVEVLRHLHDGYDRVELRIGNMKFNFSPDARNVFLIPAASDQVRTTLLTSEIAVPSRWHQL